MEAETERLAQKIVSGYKSLPNDQRLLVAIAGPPGSGKSTLAYPLTDRINALLLHHPPAHPSEIDRVDDIASAGCGAGGGDDVAVCVGLDGWHYSRKELDGFDDPVEAHWRRGAAFTFDLPAYTAFLEQLRLPLSSAPAIQGIPFPTFDHALKDPTPSPIPIKPSHRIILIEGLYTLLDKPGWRETAQGMDFRIWVECAVDSARERVILRNFKAGIVADLDKCRERVDAVDMVNGTEVRTHRIEPTDILTSIDVPIP